MINRLGPVFVLFVFVLSIVVVLIVLAMETKKAFVAP